MRAVLAVVLSSFLFVSSVRAEEAAAEGGYLPKEHDLQVMLEVPPLVNNVPSLLGIASNHGFGITVPTNGGSAVFNLGLNGALGYCITDMFEIGGALAIDVAGGNGTVFVLGVSPFVKLNLGHQLNMGSRVNPFVQTGVTVGVASASAGGGSTTGGLFIFEVEAGAEFMLTHNFGITASVLPLGIIYSGIGNSTSFQFGFQYGVVGYF